MREFETFREFFNSATLALLVDLPFIFVFLVVISVVSGPVVWVPGTAVILVIFFGLVLQPFFRSVAEKSQRTTCKAISIRRDDIRARNGENSLWFKVLEVSLDGCR